MYGNAVPGITEEYGIGEQKARVGQMIFLSRCSSKCFPKLLMRSTVAYAFGCELWSAPSEEFGRRPILQASLTLVNIWQILVALAPNYGAVVVGRFLGGICSAGGSVTLGMVADMFEPADQQFAVNFIVFSSVGGSVVGPIAGAFVQTRYNWRWNVR